MKARQNGAKARGSPLPRRLQPCLTTVCVCVCGHRPKAYVENVYYPYGVEELQGKRNYMEDRHVEAGMVGRSSLRRVWPKRRPVTPWNDMSWLWLSQAIPLRRSTPYLTGMAGRALQSA